jgi:hypothetical protein
MIRDCLRALSVVSILIAHAASAAATEPIRVELNTLENNEGRCRVTFVIENKDQGSLESLRLDLAVFNRDGVVQRRVSAELAPVRGGKTVVKSFGIDLGCTDIGSILVNDVTACAPGEGNTCLDRLDLSSRAKEVRFYK